VESEEVVLQKQVEEKVKLVRTPPDGGHLFGVALGKYPEI
jgi:hypothetical protein